MLLAMCWPRDIIPWIGLFTHDMAVLLFLSRAEGFFYKTAELEDTSGQQMANTAFCEKTAVLQFADKLLILLDISGAAART